MGEKFTEKIFTPEQLEKMAKEAADNEKAEAIRAGDDVPCPPAPGREEYGSANKTPDNKIPSRMGKPKVGLAAESGRKFDDYKKRRKDIFN